MTKDFIDEQIEVIEIKKTVKKSSKELFNVNKNNSFEIAGVQVGQKFLISDETRRKISEGNKGKIVIFSDETRRKISESNKGKVRSEETKRKISDSQKGKIISDITKEKLRESRRNMSEETKNKMIEALKRQVFSEERRRKMREAHKRRDHNRPIMTPNGEFISKEALKQRLVSDGVSAPTVKIREWFNLYPNDFFYIKKKT